MCTVPNMAVFCSSLTSCFPIIIIIIIIITMTSIIIIIIITTIITTRTTESENRIRLDILLEMKHYAIYSIRRVWYREPIVGNCSCQAFYPKFELHTFCNGA